MAQVIWTTEAERWLVEIREHIAADNPAAADRTVEGIFEKAQILAEFPGIGYCHEHPLGEIRILLYGHYRITYHIRQNGDVVIIGIFHGALDIQRYL